MRENITSAFPPTILSKDSDFCISIYMPTHRTAPDNKQDSIRFRNIVDQLADKNKYEKQVKQLRQIQNDTDFWVYNLEGLVILMNQDDMNIYRLPRKLEEHFSVGERFYLKPLIRNFQSDHRYYALGLSKDSFRLFSGNRYGFREIEVDDEERLLENFLGDQDKGRVLNVVSQGGVGGNFHGHGTKNQEVKIDTKRFFTHIDRYVDKHYTSKFKIPLILIGLPENQSVYREVSQNKHLLKEGINRSVEGIKQNDLNDYLWKALEPIYLEKTQNLIDRYHEGLSNDTSSHTLQEILKSLIQERVQTLVIEDGKTIAGTIDLEKVSFEISEDGDDILNEMAQIALSKNMEVVILPKERMPKHHSLFAIYRY